MPLVVPENLDLVMSLIKNVLTIVFIIFCGIVQHQVSRNVKEPFIDEVFHLKQCQVYCKYRFSKWDNKITTPPGLYFLGFLYTRVLQVMTNTNICENYTVLRSINLIGGVLVLPLIIRKINKSNQVWSINIVSQPLLFTYYFLFYTDIWSTILVVFSLMLTTKQPAGLANSCYLSGFVGFISLWFRQTNIVWLAFIMSILIDNRVKEHSFIKRTFKVVYQLIKDWLIVIPFLVNFILFAIFIKVNKGITFGDKENHQISLHIVQIFYCFSFISFFTWPIWLSTKTLQQYFKFLVNNHGLNIFINVLIGLLIKFIIDNFTVIHPFLLADNRHYTFYIFKKLINHKYSQLVTIPLYHFSTWIIVTSLKNSRILSTITILTYLVAICITLVPSPLFEPRYYILPLIIFRLFTRPISSKRHLFEFLWLNLINAMTTIIFFKYEFIWESEPNNIQRIIW